MFALEEELYKVYRGNGTVKDAESKFRIEYPDVTDRLVSSYGLNLDTFMYHLAVSYEQYSTAYRGYLYLNRLYRSGSAIPVLVGDIAVTDEMYMSLLENGIFNIEKIRAEFALHELGVLDLPKSKLRFKSQIADDSKHIIKPLTRVLSESVSCDAVIPVSYAGKDNYLYIEGILYDISGAILNVSWIINSNCTPYLGTKVLFLNTCDDDYNITLCVFIPSIGKCWTVCNDTICGAYNVPVVRDKVILRRVLLGIT